jgi:hypothetical protein
MELERKDQERSLAMRVPANPKLKTERDEHRWGGKRGKRQFVCLQHPDADAVLQVLLSQQLLQCPPDIIGQVVAPAVFDCLTDENHDLAVAANDCLSHTHSLRR